MSSEYMTASEGGPSQQGYFVLETPSGDSSASPSRPGTSGDNQPPKGKSRVRFNSTSEANDVTNQRSSFHVRDGSLSPTGIAFPKQTKSSPSASKKNSVTPLLRHTPEIEKTNPFADPVLNPVLNPVFKPRPRVLRSNSSTNSPSQEDVSEYNEKAFSALAAQERAQRVATLVGSNSAPNSRRNSFDEESDDGFMSPHSRSTKRYPVPVDDIPLADMDSRRTFDGASDEDECCADEKGKAKASSSSEAHKLVRAHTRKHRSEAWKMSSGSRSGMASGQVTPNEEERFAEDFVPRPQQYRSGVLSSLLKLYNAPSGSISRRGSDSSTEDASFAGTGTGSRGSSGTTTPRTKAAKWYNHKNQSYDTLAGLVEASAILGAQGGIRNPKKKPSRPGIHKKTHSGNLITSAISKMNKPRLEDEIRITVHIAETLSRQKYMLKLCRALMSYGAPTHRLEEYMKMSARVLEIDGQFLYLPGCMIISFDDVSTHTTEVKLVRAPQGVDLGKLKDIHEIYKEVVHDVIGVEEATQRLDIIITGKQKYSKWLLVFVYGFASATVAPFGKSEYPRFSNILLTLT
jgi:hypothetical protein